MSSPGIPSSCRAVVVEKAGAPWTIKQVPVSAPQAGEVLVKVRACGVCHSDSFFQQGKFGEHGFPRIPGHEVIGTVIAVGEGEKKWKVGDCVGGGWHGGHDGLCKACNRGLFQMCDNQLVNGVSKDGGCELVSAKYSLEGIEVDRDAQMRNTVPFAARPSSVSLPTPTPPSTPPFCVPA